MKTIGRDKSAIVYGERDATWAGLSSTCERCGLVVMLEGKADVHRRETFESGGTWYARGTVTCPECGHPTFLQVVQP
jgi:ribosomal protein S27AE